MSGRAPARLAWSLLGIGLGTLALVLALEFVNDDFDPGNLIYLISFNAFMLIGALIAARRPENPIGWMFCGVGLTTNLALLLLEYAHLAFNSSLPGGVIAGWLGMLIRPVAWMLVFTSFMLFPTGKPVTRPMGLFVWAFVALFGLSILVDAVSTPTLSDFPTVANPFYIDALDGLGSVGDSVVGFVALAGIGITAVLRFLKSTPVERLQLKWVTYSVILVIVLGVITGALQDTLESSLGIPPEIFDLIVVLAILWLAVAVAIAMLRYRLYDIDVIINRTLVYVPLTGILAGVYAAGVGLLQRVFQSVTGEKSDFAIVITTLALTALFTPVKNGLQGVVDRRWKEAPGSLKKLKAFGKQVEESLAAPDPNRVMRRLLKEAALALGAGSGVAYLQKDGQMQLVQAYGDWQDGGDSLAVNLESAGEQVGLIKLAPRGAEADFSSKERKAVQEVADMVAGAISS
jgi:hypothetical protein